MKLDMDAMREMQQALQARYAGWWEPIDPAHGGNKMLWMLAEMGEAIQVVKRHHGREIMNDKALRDALIEELADVMMYFNDILLCYDITPEEFGEIYRRKHERNMIRWKKPDDPEGNNHLSSESM